jgi:hypothetical protein
MIQFGRRGAITLTFTGIFIIVGCYWLFYGFWKKPKEDNAVKTKGTWHRNVEGNNLQMDLTGSSKVCIF